MDCYNGEIVSFNIADTQDVSFVLETLNQIPEMNNDCILHSDQGSVYTSYSYQRLVKNKSIAMSMSRKGTPADNAPIESFHSTLKSETFYLFPELCSSTEIVTQTVVNFIKYYNESRIQAKLVIYLLWNIDYKLNFLFILPLVWVSSTLSFSLFWALLFD